LYQKTNLKTIKGKNMNKIKYLLLFTLILIVSIVLFTSFYSNNPNYNLLKVKVSNENDDGRTFETISEVGFGDEIGAWANLQINPSYSFGVKFDNITIPKGSKIGESYVKLYSIGLPGSHEHVNCIIYGDDVDNAVNFSVKGCLDRCNRNYTDNYILWNKNTPFKKWVKTPSLNNIIQEIIDREGWINGNSIAILFITRNTNDTAVFSNYGNGNPPEIIIKWQ
jgi:hypothetical protein